ncbi:CDP-diacylglycerol--glycerol-3-phosphate 3-phosphatidyltransferase [Cellulomonas hominis]|uniref:CDP-diacylglycerol--glycerol-3-phosphate 3-phosphatidyltransferase n=1 Tax=Cellulomonas hominis TaxID=156981 RepID=A0A511F8E9_9CELL|nr:CDP-diacylglycerol--glycerol-3-phosphate 3-phosphatidyltransferase [Cellulomonas hominis]MBB5474367.1 CDP-diacylglycerol--glycerol-3-phosphate 3-phosphatidyltransferase/cardiolipin synthase [Cellulomonas hominis]NKY08048.1 CDP-diacylglycerol--glycerol-3-phosphate 3-phosphatidyltransferase [Cellulomonas hominis]NKY12206.1 CDP-diacylglycerol--glycerol-3-phosphate 3-phosphatidyltransferase [Cellulomonas hominis]GEL45546.1 CDP-diacylglycerol--glycerol-3-phosphate 3-phosphatidyltransferase [Cellu
MSRPSPLNVANVLTVLRIVVVPFVAWALLVDGGQDPVWRLVAAGLFALAAATDRVDGYLARRLGLVTDLGKLLDPIADKALIGTALVALSWLGELPWWVTVAILVRELGITVMRFFLLKYLVLPASRGGKIKTVLQSVAVGLFLLPLDHLPGWVTVVAWVLMVAAVVVTLVTGADYVRTAVRVHREHAAGRGAEVTRHAADTGTTSPRSDGAGPAVASPR